MWLSIVYHQNRRYGAHDPRLCYESQGYLVEPQGRRRWPTAARPGSQVNVFLADRPHERRLVYYWWTTRGLATADVGRDAAAHGAGGALDNRSWGAFVRVETRLGDGGEPAAAAALDDFAARVARALPGVFAAAERRPGA